MGYGEYSFESNGEVRVLGPNGYIYRIGTWKARDARTIVVNFPETGAYSAYKPAETEQFVIESSNSIRYKMIYDTTAGRKEVLREIYTGGAVKYDE
jgi:hypothetical protein